MNSSIQMRALLEAIEEERTSVVAHPLYAAIRDVRHVRIFMEHHVFAVWDFMCLLKSLQRALTSVDVVWRPVSRPETRRLINEIVLVEESDVVGGRTLSHFELYLDAMEEVGASTTAARTFVELLSRGAPLSLALAESGAPVAAQAFVRSTMALVERGRAHEVAAAFTLGRELPIPLMFTELDRSTREAGLELPTLHAYLERHVEVDGEEHGPAAARLLEELCGVDGTAWTEATNVARQALLDRGELWTAIARALPEART